jgi:hypothetical protein
MLLKMQGASYSEAGQTEALMESGSEMKSQLLGAALDAKQSW